MGSKEAHSSQNTISTHLFSFSSSRSSHASSRVQVQGLCRCMASWALSHTRHETSKMLELENPTSVVSLSSSTFEGMALLGVSGDTCISATTFSNFLFIWTARWHGGLAWVCMFSLKLALAELSLVLLDHCRVFTLQHEVLRHYINTFELNWNWKFHSI